MKLYFLWYVETGLFVIQAAREGESQTFSSIDGKSNSFQGLGAFSEVCFFILDFVPLMTSSDSKKRKKK